MNACNADRFCMEKGRKTQNRKWNFWTKIEGFFTVAMCVITTWDIKEAKRVLRAKPWFSMKDLLLIWDSTNFDPKTLIKQDNPNLGATKACYLERSGLKQGWWNQSGGFWGLRAEPTQTLTHARGWGLYACSGRAWFFASNTRKDSRAVSLLGAVELDLCRLCSLFCNLIDGSGDRCWRIWMLHQRSCSHFLLQRASCNCYGLHRTTRLTGHLWLQWMRQCCSQLITWQRDLWWSEGKPGSLGPRSFTLPSYQASPAEHAPYSLSVLKLDKDSTSARRDLTCKRKRYPIGAYTSNRGRVAQRDLSALPDWA